MRRARRFGRGPARCVTAISLGNASCPATRCWANRLLGRTPGLAGVFLHDAGGVGAGAVGGGEFFSGAFGGAVDGDAVEQFLR